MYVESDYAHLRIAARESLEEGWALQGAERTLRLGRAQDRAAYIERRLPKRTLAEGYYTWIDYLLWLSDVHEVVSFRNLTATEVEGIRIVREARDQFLARHPRCGKCGAMNDRSALNCADCGVEFS